MFYIYLAASIALNASANILFKIGSVKKQTSYSDLHTLLDQNWPIITGLLFFAISTVTYILALRTFPISVTYPILVGCSIILTNILSSIYLHEKINPFQIIGYCLIILGVIIVFSGQQK